VSIDAAIVLAFSCVMLGMLAGILITISSYRRNK